MTTYEIMSIIPVLDTTDIISIEDAVNCELYLNNSVLHKDTDYIILESGMVQFNTPITKDDILMKKVLNQSNRAVISVNPSKSLYQKYSSSNTLLNNIRYAVNLSVKGDNFTLSFRSKFSPFYMINAKETVKTDIGTLISEFSMSDINYEIYMSSKDFDNVLSLNDYTQVLDDVGIDIRNRWVRYKSALDLLNSIYLSKTGSYGTERKRLGNLEIEVQTKMPNLTNMTQGISRLFEQADSDLKELVGVSAGIMTSFVKAGNTSYPLNTRTW